MQYLSVKYAEKLESSSTVDDAEGTLSKFIPQGEQNLYILSWSFSLTPLRLL